MWFARQITGALVGVFALTQVVCGQLSYDGGQGRLRYVNKADHDVHVAVVMWVADRNDPERIEFRALGFHRISPGERVDLWEENQFRPVLMYRLIAHQIGEETRFEEPNADDRNANHYIDLLQESTERSIPQKTVRCSAIPQVVKGYVRPQPLKMTFSDESGVIEALRAQKRLRFVGTIIPNSWPAGVYD